MVNQLLGDYSTWIALDKSANAVSEAVNVSVDESLAILYNACIVKVAKHGIEDANILAFNLKVRLTSIGAANIVGAFVVTVVAVLTLIASIATITRFR